jgi:hypothetical protein
LKYGQSVLRIGAYPKIEVFCVAGLGILDQGIAADHQVFNAVGVVKPQQIGEVGVDEHLVLSRAMHEQLIPRRLQIGLWIPWPGVIFSFIFGRSPLPN